MPRLATDDTVGGPQPPRTPPTDADAIAHVPAQFFAQQCDAVAISAVQDFETAVADWTYGTDNKAMHAVKSVVGRWWKTADDFNGHNVWRKEDIDVWLFYEPKFEGFVIAPTLVNATDQNVLAWAPLNNVDEFAEYPAKLHIPYWSKKPCPIVR